MLPAFCLVCLVSFAQKTSVDTVFLSRQMRDGKWYSKVYIEKKKNSSRYTSLRSFGSRSSAAASKPFPFGKWIELKQYKDRMYLYYPCEMGANNFRAEISKTHYFLSRIEDDNAPITSLHRVKPWHYTFDASMPGTGQKQKQKVNIYQLDKEKGIAIIEQLGAAPERFYLVVSADKMANYPLIVHDYNAKTDEYSFTPPDFNQLLRKLK